MSRYYVLDDENNPVRELDMRRWWESRNRAHFHVAEDFIEADNGSPIRISTVFFGVDHQFGDGPPLLWETMIFGGPHHGYQERYSSKKEAITGHARAIRLVLGEH